MKKTFYVGNDSNHKIDVDFRITGKEKIYVDGVLVVNDRNFSKKGNWKFSAGNHEVIIKYESNLKRWSCPVFVDGKLFIEELFDNELKGHKKRISFLPKYIKLLGILVFLYLLFSFFKGFYQGATGG